MSKFEKRYLGDGVYAEYDGYQIKLTAENGLRVTDTIYLDPNVMEEIVIYILNLNKKENGQETEEQGPF